MRRHADYQVIATGFGRLEAPTAIEGGSLMVSDITLGGVHEVDLRTGARRVVVPHRKGIGGLCRHIEGWIVSGRNLSLRTDAGASVTLLESDAQRGVMGLNDMTADCQGRLYVGAMGFRFADGLDAAKPGKLYRVGLDGEAVVLDDDLALPNGMAFSPNDRWFYQSDSLRGVVFAYPVDESGELGPRRPFASVPEGMADGVAVAVDGSVWVAAAGAGAVFRFDPEGGLMEHLDFPWPMLTSVCFSVPTDAPPRLYVTTGPEGAARSLGGGAILEMPVEIGGVPRWIARVASAGAS